MPDCLEEDGNTFIYELIDIRDFDGEALMATGKPAGLASAILAGGGKLKLVQILKEAAKLEGGERDRVLAQVLLLARLRGLAGRVEWQLRNMGVVIDVTKNEVLMRWRKEAMEEGRAEGLSQRCRKACRRRCISN